MGSLDFEELLEYINPSNLSYQEWINVGMALKLEGYPVSVWDKWSARDFARYHSGECGSKWRTFKGSASPVTGGTLYEMAKQGGYSPEKEQHELDWDAVIGAEYTIIDKRYIDGADIPAPSYTNHAEELIDYLNAVFDTDDNVGYVMQSYLSDKGKYIPQNKGNYDRTAGQLIEQLTHCHGDIGSVLGDYDIDAGAWIRINPLDGKGVKNDNVTEYKYTLVESDTTDISRQYAIMQELELPIAALVHSGNKSIHALVRVDADTFTEYRKRVDFIYKICEKNGLKIDTQNRNPSRLSRMPGVQRGNKRQYLIGTNLGKSSYAEWREWIEGINDTLPDMESLSEYWNNLPELSEPLIDGVLRQGHKMLIAGPSKAGKSFALIELCIAIAEGTSWFGHACTSGRVLYVNLELDRASCLHRFKDVYDAQGVKPANIAKIDIWNLRGQSVPMDKLAPKLIRRASKKQYIAIVIDPIYKVLTGDENNASEMAKFCNQFDKICTELGCSVIYCHHHSKGAQGQKKAMDRSSGSGVFARDPDAVLDIIELELDNTVLKAADEQIMRNICTFYMNGYINFNAMDFDTAEDTLACVRGILPKEKYAELIAELAEKRKKLASRTAWRVDGTLREYAPLKPIDMWFEYPVHVLDTSGILKDAAPDTDMPYWQKSSGKTKGQKSSEGEQLTPKLTPVEQIEQAYDALNTGEPVTIQDLGEYLDKSERTVWRYMKKSGKFKVHDGIVKKENS